jgi:pyruvate/2-oxoglutarate dehydrogenase complex dihydrolipoamide acyltransferase (E2) component
MSGARVETFHLADLGEGLIEAFVQEILVQVGDVIEMFAPVAVIETEKSTVEITSPFAGTVTRVAATTNEYINVGDPIIEVEVTGE